MTCWLPCITYGEIKKALHGGVSVGNTSMGLLDPTLLYLLVCIFTDCQCILGMINRSDIRKKYNLKAEPCNDFCVHCWCHGCALCQELRELRRRPLTQWPALPPVAPYQPGPYAQQAPVIQGQVYANTAPPTPQGPVYQSDIQAPPSKF